jgi:hypothetical protein
MRNIKNLFICNEFLELIELKPQTPQIIHNKFELMNPIISLEKSSQLSL